MRLYLSILLTLFFILPSCGGGPDGGNPVKTNVTVNLGQRELSADTISLQVIPDSVNSVVIRISGGTPSMSTIERTINVDGLTQVVETISVPNGDNRLFQVFAFSGVDGEGTLLYQGEETENVPPPDLEVTVVMYEVGTVPYVGTWGVMSISHGSWSTESNKITIRDDGTGTNVYYRNDNGIRSNGTEDFTYTIDVNPDGSYTLWYDPEGPDPAEPSILVFSDNGNIFIENYTSDVSEQSMMVGIRLRDDSSYTDADFNGDFYHIGYDHDPNGTYSYNAWSGLFNADGAGNVTDDAHTVNGDGTIYNPPTDDMTYAVNPDGSVSFDGDAPTSFLSADGNLLIHSSTDETDYWGNDLLLKQGDRTYSTADMEGTWAIAGFGDYEGTVFREEFGQATCDEGGSCDITLKSNSSNGETEIIIVNEVYAISSSDGRFGESIPTTPDSSAPYYAAAIGNDGNTFIMNRSFDPDDYNDKGIVIGVKCSGCSFDIAAPTGPTQISPEVGGVLDNGCEPYDEGDDQVEWDFTWTGNSLEPPDRYHVIVELDGEETPIYDVDFIQNVNFHPSHPGYPDSELTDEWSWKVRALVNGVWSGWSTERSFFVEDWNFGCS